MKNDTPSHLTLAQLLVWLRDTYPKRVYTNRGLPIPAELADGYTQTMVADCMKKQGFERCDQTAVSRMETGEGWPGRRNPDEKEPFLRAAAHCYQIRHAKVQRLLKVALFMQSGAEGLSGDFTQDMWQVLKKWAEDPEE